jgi:hypothetical protein
MFHISFIQQLTIFLNKGPCKNKLHKMSITIETTSI